MLVDRGYLDHWKTHSLRQLTGLPNASELPLRLWEHCESRRNDFIEDTTGNIIAGICRAGIEPKALLKALVDCRFLDKAPKGYVVHGWRERNSSWLRKVEGGQMRASKAVRNGKGQLRTSTLPATNELPASQLPPSSQLASPNSEKLAASSQLAGSTAGAVEWSGVEKSRVPADPPPRLRSEERVNGSGQILSETSSRITALFDGKKRRLGREAEGELERNLEVLPLMDEEWRLLAWWLRLPCDEADPFLRDGSRPKDADRLAIRLFSELDRAKGHAKKCAPQKKEPPAGWREWFARKWTELPVPETFEALPEYVRQEAWRELQAERSAA